MLYWFKKKNISRLELFILTLTELLRGQQGQGKQKQRKTWPKLLLCSVWCLIALMVLTTSLWEKYVINKSVFWKFELDYKLEF